MASKNERLALTQAEIDALPPRLSVAQGAAVLGCSNHYLSDNAPEFGGQKIAGRWQFSKRKLLAMLEGEEC